MEATIKVQLKQAVKTESQWRSSNPVIPDGCMAITSDRGNAYKVGDGSSEWNDLSYNTAIAQDVYSWAKKEGKPSYTKSEVGLGNVDNKSSEQIRAELTKKNVVDALGYTPLAASADLSVNSLTIGNHAKLSYDTQKEALKISFV